jgi:PAS domain S-box-containing protein
VLGEDGEVQYLVVFQVDVTNRVARQRELERANNVLRSNAAELEALYNQIRAGEGELREHERMLSTLLSNLPGMAYRCRNDANWSAEFVSEGCMELTGYDPEDFKTGGRASLYSLVHEEDRDRIRREVDESVAQDTPFQLEYRISTRQGAERWVWEKGLAITNERGDLVALEGFIADNTERRLAENQRAQLVTALEQAAESIVITDVEGTIRYVNPAFCRVSGYDASEAIGKNARFLRSGEHAPEFYRAMWETLSRGETWQGRIINRKKDGSLFEEEMSISPVRNEAGLLTSYVGVKRDVTREVEIEKRLRQSQKLEAIGTLAGGIAHDFNNILLPILGFTELLQSRFAVDDTAQSHLAAVVTACHRAKALIQQILTFSGRAEVERKPVCIDDVIAEAVHLLRASIPSTISIRRRSDSARGLAMAAPIELHQIVMNLGTNAYHAMKQTGGQLTVTTQTLVADERLSTRIPTLVLSRRYVMVQVEDTGTGIKPEILERVFDPFFTTKDKGQGTGLGLATVHGIVRDLGGEIAVESQVGRGTQITVYLPAYEGVKPDSESIAPIIVMGKGEQVLVVDDDDAILQYETMLLERLGYSVTAVNDPREALARWRAEPDRYDLLFTDQTMPDQTGTALAAELRSLGMRIPVVVTSGMNDQATAQLARSVNRCRFLPKPFTQAEASTVLRSLLDADERHAEENSK